MWLPYTWEGRASRPWQWLRRRWGKKEHVRAQTTSWCCQQASCVSYGETSVADGPVVRYLHSAPGSRMQITLCGACRRR
jgi:hypothetical protein